MLRSKFPVVFWGDEGVGKDVKRIHEYVEKGKAQLAIAIFIDERELICSSKTAPQERLDRLG